ncbi:MAG TPA: hypothetical protein VFI15_04830 [Candidatus Limnocylindrales bacterium]|nr:hypothetical protein [Candidatus Limnocylindrales bacterium]
MDILTTQLTITSSNLDSIDRKAVFLPPFLVGIGTLLLPPAPWFWLQSVLLIAALLIGIRSLLYVRWIVLPKVNYLGPKSSAVVENVGTPAPFLRVAIARELAVAVNNGEILAAGKSEAFRRSLEWASVAILCLIVARAAGGLTLTDQSGQGSSPAPSQSQPATPAPATPAPATAAPATPAPATAAPATPAAPSAPPPVGQNIPNLGQQTIQGTEPSIPVLGQQTVSLGEQTMVRELVSFGQQTIQKARLDPPPTPPVKKEG